jgi:hypothetical protein
MSTITITDVATVVENSGITDDFEHHERFIDWLWETAKYSELNDICASRYPDLDSKFAEFLSNIEL